MAGFTPLSFRPAHVGLLAAAVLSGCALNNPPPVDIGNTAPVSAGQIAPPDAGGQQQRQPVPGQPLPPGV